MTPLVISIVVGLLSVVTMLLMLKEFKALVSKRHDLLVQLQSEPQFLKNRYSGLARLYMISSIAITAAVIGFLYWIHTSL